MIPHELTPVAKLVWLAVNGHVPGVAVNCTHQALADALGLTRQQVTRALAQLGTNMMHTTVRSGINMMHTGVSQLGTNMMHTTVRSARKSFKTNDNNCLTHSELGINMMHTTVRFLGDGSPAPVSPLVSPPEVLPHTPTPNPPYNPPTTPPLLCPNLDSSIHLVARAHDAREATVSNATTPQNAPETAKAKSHIPTLDFGEENATRAKPEPDTAKQRADAKPAKAKAPHQQVYTTALAWWWEWVEAFHGVKPVNFSAVEGQALKSILRSLHATWEQRGCKPPAPAQTELRVPVTGRDNSTLSLTLPALPEAERATLLAWAWVLRRLSGDEWLAKQARLAIIANHLTKILGTANTAPKRSGVKQWDDSAAAAAFARDIAANGVDSYFNF